MCDARRVGASLSQDRVFTCAECGASLTLAPERRSTACPYCKCSNILERAPDPNRPSPALVLPFSADAEAARRAVRAWTRRLRLTRETLSSATIEGIEGIYLPAYLYSASARSGYSASIGENYTETHTYTVMVNGRPQVRTRTVTKTEWRQLSGEHVGFIADILVTASRGLPNDELERIEPFDLDLLRRYAPALVSGWTIEDATLSPNESVTLARDEAREEIARRIARHLPGDSHRDLQFHTQLEHESLDLALVPIWVLVLRVSPSAPPKRVLVNGHTLEVWGPESRSWWKIALIVLAVLALVGGCAVTMLLAYAVFEYGGLR